MKEKMFICVMVVLICLLGFGGGCKSDAQTGALIGGGVGAIAGQAIGGDTKSTLIGAAIGSVGGYMFGNEGDKKEAEARTQTALQNANTFHVNVANSNGSFTAVRVVKSGNFYIAEGGERYLMLPTEAQLKAAGYGF